MTHINSPYRALGAVPDGEAGDRYEAEVQADAAQALVDFSRWVDAYNAHRDPEAATWGRLAKVSEEAGEVIEAMVGWTAQNPRKGEANGKAKVINELLDVAFTALGAIEHLTDHQGRSLIWLAQHARYIAVRAGLREA